MKFGSWLHEIGNDLLSVCKELQRGKQNEALVEAAEEQAYMLLISIRNLRKKIGMSATG